MSLEKSHYKYLHINSGSMDKANDFKVHIPHGLENCVRVCVKRFSIPNTMGNNYSNLNKFHFVEFMKTNGTTPAYKGAQSGVWYNGWTAKHFYIKLDDIPNYTTNTEIVTHINSKFASGEVYDFETDQQTHQFGSEDALGVEFSYDASTYIMSYKITSTQTTNTNIKIFMPCIHDNDGGIWHHLGFHAEEFFVVTGNQQTRFPHRTIAMMEEDLSLTYPVIYAEASDVPAGDVDRSYAQFNTLYSPTYARLAGKVVAENMDTFRTSVAENPSIHENPHSGIYVCSDELGQDGMEVRHNYAIGTNVLEFIENDEPRYSHLHYKSGGMLTWHKCNNPSIRAFDIKIRDHRFRLIDPTHLPNFTLILAFEFTQPVEFDKQFIEAYNRAGFRMAHQI